MEDIWIWMTDSDQLDVTFTERISESLFLGYLGGS